MERCSGNSNLVCELWGGPGQRKFLTGRADFPHQNAHTEAEQGCVLLNLPVTLCLHEYGYMIHAAYTSLTTNVADLKVTNPEIPHSQVTKVKNATRARVESTFVSLSLPIGTTVRIIWKDRASVERIKNAHPHIGSAAARTVGHNTWGFHQTHRQSAAVGRLLTVDNDCQMVL